MRLISLFFILLFNTYNTSQAQTRAQIDSLPNTINNEFLKLYRLSSNWQQYKMVKKGDFLNFQKRVLDSVTIIKKDLISKQETINQQAVTISSLNGKIAQINGDLSVSKDKENSISFFGAELSKAAYNSILWLTIAGLLAGLFFFIYKFKNSNVITKEAEKSLAELEQDFDRHRKKAIEREQKLRRQLQDEINKQRGI